MREKRAPRTGVCVDGPRAECHGHAAGMSTTRRPSGSRMVTARWQPSRDLPRRRVVRPIGRLQPAPPRRCRGTAPAATPGAHPAGRDRRGRELQVTPDAGLLQERAGVPGVGAASRGLNSCRCAKATPSAAASGGSARRGRFPQVFRAPRANGRRISVCVTSGCRATRHSCRDAHC
jgi:hypothetical protein